jgi:hypothetical protein
MYQCFKPSQKSSGLTWERVLPLQLCHPVVAAVIAVAVAVSVCRIVEHVYVAALQVNLAGGTSREPPPLAEVFQPEFGQLHASDRQVRLLAACRSGLIGDGEASGLGEYPGG